MAGCAETGSIEERTVSARGVVKHIRLLPVVIALGAMLLTVKAAGLVRDAQAQASSPATTAAFVQPVTAPRSGTEGDDTESSSSEVDVLTSLSKRRTELDARERELKVQQDLIAAAEKRVDDKIASLKTLQSQIQALLVQRDAAQVKQLGSLVKTYSAMKPKDAARIFNTLDEGVLVDVANQMKPDVLAAILELMQSEPAQKLTLKLADRLKLPDPPPAPPPAPPQALQTASVAPTAAPAAVPAASAPTATAASTTMPNTATPTAKVADTASDTPSTTEK
jgi:flagellar motility protein MotE (MotC chaperone)